MAKDFRASQIQTTQIISSGSNGTNAKIVFYDISAQSTSNPNQGIIDPTKFNTGSIGNDIFLYVSGAIGGKGGSSPVITTFGGDIHISGNITADGTSPWTANDGDWIDLGSELTTTSSVFISSSLTISGTLNGSGFYFTGSRAHFKSNTIIDLAVGEDVFANDLKMTISSSSPFYSETVFAKSNAPLFTILGENSLILSGADVDINSDNDTNIYLYPTKGNGTVGLSAPDIEFDSSKISIYNPAGATRRVLITSSIGNVVAISASQISITDDANNTPLGTDVKTYFTGVIGSKDSSTAGVGVFAGDLHVSGNLTVDGPISASGGLSGSLQQITTGVPYLVGQGSVSITTQSNGQVIISGSGGSGGGAVEIKLTGSQVEPAVSSLNFIGNNFDVTGSGGSVDVLAKDQFSYTTIETGKSVTIHSNQQMLYEGDLTVDGDLTIDGESVQVVGDVEKVRATSIITSPITASAGQLIRVNPAAGAVEIALPLSPKLDAEIAVKNITTSSNNITIDGKGINIDGSGTYIMNTSREWVMLHYDGIEWLQIG